MLIRKATSEDSLALGHVYCNSWKKGYKNIIPQLFLDSLTSENCAPKPERINCNNNYIAEENGSVIGLVNFGEARDKDAGNMGELRSIYVIPEFWGKGVSRELFQAAVSELEKSGYSGFYLWVLKENGRARGFYEKMKMMCSGCERVITIGGKELVESKYIKKF